MASESPKWTWLNGKMLRRDDALTNVWAHGLHYGTGVFEGIRSYDTAEGPAIFRMDAHLDRLFASAAVYGIPMPYSRELLTEATHEVIRRNGWPDCYLRPICFLGTNTLGIRAECPPEVAILAVPALRHGTAEEMTRGIRTTISQWLKFDTRAIPSTAKAAGQYLNSVLAARDAAARGFDDAFLLNAQGNIAEASVSNVFFIRDGVVYTNDEKSSILLGITRDSVIQIARALGYEVRIGDIRREDLMRAEEIFLTGTATEILPVREIDGTIVGRGSRGPITERIYDTFVAAARGKDARFRHWLDFVPQLQTAHFS
ncbi:MAG: branched-chain amino acid transaminase [Acidobacteria bacterium]|nr:branched-chain amino acid transaminase [Acidobacteriota bacterium]